MQVTDNTQVLSTPTTETETQTYEVHSRSPKATRQRQEQLAAILAYRVPADSRPVAAERNKILRDTCHLRHLELAMLLTLWRLNQLDASSWFKCSLARVAEGLKPRRSSGAKVVSRVALANAGRQLCALGVIARKQPSAKAAALWQFRLPAGHSLLSPRTVDEIEYTLASCRLAPKEIAVYARLRAEQDRVPSLYLTQRQMEEITGCDRHTIKDVLFGLGGNRLVKTDEFDRNAAIWRVDLRVELPAASAVKSDGLYGDDSDSADEIAHQLVTAEEVLYGGKPQRESQAPVPRQKKSVAGRSAFEAALDEQMSASGKAGE